MNYCVNARKETVVFEPGQNSDWYAHGVFYGRGLQLQTDEAGDNIIRAFGKMKYFIKSKTVRKEVTEMAVEVYCKNNDTFFIEKIRDIEGVQDVTLIQYNGEYHG